MTPRNVIASRLHQRIQAIVDTRCGGNLKEFARQVGINYNTLQHNMSKGYDDLLLKHTQKVLSTFPDVPKSWFISGEGVLCFTEHPPTIGEHSNIEEKAEALVARIHELEAEVRAEQAEKQKLKDRLQDVHGSYWELNEEFRMFRKQLPGGHLENPPTSSSGDVPTQADAADSSAQSSE